MSLRTEPELTLPTRGALPDVSLPPTGEACLVRIYPPGPALPTRYVLTEGPLVLGREEDCDVRVDDRAVSRRHARVEPDGDAYRVVDLESTNGTYVNEVRVGVRRLRDGDNLFVGHSIFRFLTGGSPEAVYHEEIHRRAVLDPLTGAYNQRYLLEALERERQRALRSHRPLALLLLDVDSFKRVNDSLGHLAGDACLRELAARVHAVLGREAVFGRYGGEEFAAVLPGTPLAGGVAVAERARARVEGHPFWFEGGAYRVTVSVGVAAAAGDELIASEELIRLADAGLYRAKREGRNRVVAEQAFPGPATPEALRG